MIKANGKCRIDGLEVGELSYNGISSPTPVLTVKFAYVSYETGDRYGFGNRNVGWSEKTLELMKEFLTSVESDIAAEVFDLAPTTDGATGDGSTTTDSIPSL